MPARRVTPRLLLALLLAAPVLLIGTVATAPAQVDPFAPQPFVTPDRPGGERQPVAPGFEEEDDGLDGGEKALIIIAGVAVLGVIAAAIVLDARRRRPRAETELRGERAGDDGHDAAHRRAENRRRKAKAKQARASRKRNRPRR